MARLDECHVPCGRSRAAAGTETQARGVRRTLIDLGRIAELRGIEILEDGSPPAGGKRVGRGGPHWRDDHIRRDRVLTRRRPRRASASTAAAVISDPLIRNRATLGGSLAEADPHGDWPPVVLAADATMHLRSRDGERALPASEFFTMTATDAAANAPR